MKRRGWKRRNAERKETKTQTAKTQNAAFRKMENAAEWRQNAAARVKAKRGREKSKNAERKRGSSTWTREVSETRDSPSRNGFDSQIATNACSFSFTALPLLLPIKGAVGSTKRRRKGEGEAKLCRISSGCLSNRIHFLHHNQVIWRDLLLGWTSEGKL